MEETPPLGQNFALTWLLTATFGCAIGAALAVELFPELGFASNPTGEFHPEMFLFTGLVGLGLGLGQALVLGWMRALPLWRLALWVVLTTIAVVGMILPLWWVDAVVFMFAPWRAIISLGPGLVALALLQGLLLHPRVVWHRWLVSTLIGGALGSVGGLIVAMVFATVLYVVPFEAFWGGSVAAAMALFQRKHLPGRS